MGDSKQGGPGIDERIMMAVVRVSELFKRRSAAIFAGHGLSFPQYNVIRVLAAARDECSSVSEISRRLLVSTPNMSGIAKRLEKMGFVRRFRDPADERRTLLALEPRARQALADIGDQQERNIGAFMKACPPGRKQEFLDLLKEMLNLEG